MWSPWCKGCEAQIYHFPLFPFLFLHFKTLVFLFLDWRWLRSFRFTSERGRERAFSFGLINLKFYLYNVRVMKYVLSMYQVGVIGNLVHSSPNIKKEVLAAGALQPVIGLLRYCYFLLSFMFVTLGFMWNVASRKLLLVFFYRVFCFSHTDH